MNHTTNASSASATEHAMITSIAPGARRECDAARGPAAIARSTSSLGQDRGGRNSGQSIFCTC